MPVAVLFGSQWHLKQQAVSRLKELVLGADADDTAVSRFSGPETDVVLVLDELRTVSMWSAQRLVIVDDGDDFVSRHRAALEKYVAAPSKKGVLVLVVSSWPKTTRLAKLVAQSGLDLDCSELKGAALSKWLQDTALQTYQLKLPRDAAALLMELIGEELGALDQELNKLSAYAGASRQVTADDVRQLVAGWKVETTWAMADAVRDGQVGTALAALHDLLASGEAPMRLLGGIGFVFRKLALATELSRSQPLEDALRAAGVFPRDIGLAASYLKRLGRSHADRLLPALLQADVSLKGGSKLPDRVILERLLLQLAGTVAVRDR
jgi:DNA polymerase III subunit delta